MELVAIVTVLALIEYNVFGMLVGRARGAAGVQAPATSGDPVFERYFRVHQNTAEQLVLFVPALWMFGYYLSPAWAAAIGLVFVIGRVVYLRGYVADPQKRGTGFAIGFLAQAVLLIGALVGAILSFL